MSEKRTMSIGVTINLGNYENLHLEVSDIAETRSDAGELRRFLSDVLDDFAANNAAAKQSIDKYREKILDDSENPESDDFITISSYDVDVPSADNSDNAADKQEVSEVRYKYDDSKDKDEDKNSAALDDSESRSPPQIQSSESKITEVSDTKQILKEEIKKQDETEPQRLPDGVFQGEYTCEKCGAVVSKIQRDVSNMFMGKTLCKNCMK